MLIPCLGIVAKGIHTVAPEATFFVPELQYLKGGDQGEGPVFYPDSDHAKVTLALFEEMGITRIKQLLYRADLAYAAADAPTAD